MSRFDKLSHVLWHCQYHIVWVPKYRYRILTGDVGNEVFNCIQIYSKRLSCEVIELNVQPEHVHLLIKVPPKQSISDLMGALKGRSAIKIFKQFPDWLGLPGPGEITILSYFFLIISLDVI